MRGLPDGGVNHVAVSPAGLTLAVLTEASGPFVRSDGGEWSRVHGWRRRLGLQLWETRFLPDGRLCGLRLSGIWSCPRTRADMAAGTLGQAFRALAVDMHGAILPSACSVRLFSIGEADRDWAEAGQIPGNACTAFVPAWDGMWLVRVLWRNPGIGVHGDVMTESWQALVADVFSMAVGPAGTIFAGLEEGLAVRPRPGPNVAAGGHCR